MKKKLFLLLLSTTIFISCKNKINNVVNQIEDMENEVKVNISNGSKGYTTNCYQYINMQDTINLILDRPDQNRITGSLQYKFAQQDNFSGVLSGFINGDTIFADYTMMQKGQIKIQEVAFLNKGNYYIQGFAAMDSIPGKIIFVKGAHLRFDQSTKLEVIDCP